MEYKFKIFLFAGRIIKNVDDTGEYLKKINSNIANDYITFNSNQFKNLDNKTPTKDLDIRFELKEIAEDNKKYKGKTLYNDSEIYDYNFLTSLHDMVVLSMPSLETVKSENKIDREKAINQGLLNAQKVGRKVDNRQYAIKNLYTGKEIVIGPNGLRHSLRGNQFSLRTNARLSAIGGEIIQNALPINGLIKQNKQAEGTYALACLVKDNNFDVVAIVTVDEFKSKALGIEFVGTVHSVNGRRQKKIACLP